MTRILGLAPLMILLLCGFKLGSGGAPSLAGPVDGTDAVLKAYKEGTNKVPYWVVVHADPKAGQYWETSCEVGGGVTTTRWQVASVDGTTAIIEQQSKVESKYFISDHALAFKVDLNVKAGEVNVTKAWAGRPGKQAFEVQVMEKPAAQPENPSDNPGYELVEEDFKDLELAGKKWSGKKSTYKGRGWESSSWVATGGWFGGVLKTQVGEVVTELKKTGDDAEALLTLPKEKEEKDEKKDEKKEDKKEEK
jgi:hypothetical protein